MYRQSYPDAPGMHNMPGDGHTRTTFRRNPNFCERIGNSLFGIVIGFILLLVAGGLLYWNEGRAVQTAQSLEEGLNIVVPLQTADVAFSGNNGKLVHLSGPLQTQQMLYDPLYHLSVPAVKLRRKVEIYQWVEHETKREYNEGSETRVETSYSYSLEWKSELIRSSSFDNRVGHENPTSVSVTSTTHVADKVHVGNFLLSSGLVDRITDFKQLTPTYIGQPQDPSIKLYMGALYHSYNPANPQVGDLRVTFEYAGLSQDSALGPAARIVSRYDVILIQEVRDKSNRSVNLLLNKLNEHVKATDTSASFAYKSSPRLGRTRYKERYVYFYRRDRVQVLATHLFTESNGDVFEREPFCLLVSMGGTDPWNLALVGLHAKPSAAVEELGYLTDQVEREVKVKWKTQNLMYLGDFNADCRYARPSHLAVTPIFSLPRYLSLIGSHLDTTTSRTHCAYDRIVVTGSDVMNAIRGARVYLFDKELRLSPELTQKVSDHYPVEVELDVVHDVAAREVRQISRM